MFTVGNLRPTFYLFHSLYNTKHFHVMHNQTLNITVPHACYGLFVVQHYSFIRCKDVEWEDSRCILRERVCVLVVPVWVLPAYLHSTAICKLLSSASHTPATQKILSFPDMGLGLQALSPLTCLPLRVVKSMRWRNHRSELKWWNCMPFATFDFFADKMQTKFACFSSHNMYIWLLSQSLSNYNNQTSIYQCYFNMLF